MRTVRLLWMLGLATGIAHAQSVVWRTPILAEFGNQAYAFLDERPGFDMPSATMARCDKGEPGFVLPGAAMLSPSPWNTDITPYIAKLATRDGRLLWHWSLESEGLPEGRIARIAVDASGDVLATGTVRGESGSVELLLLKLDGSTGDVIWRVGSGVAGSGFDVALDAGGDAYVTHTGAAHAGQVVAKYSGSSGSLLWSTAFADAQSTWDDYKIVLGQDGNPVSAGFFVDFEPSPAVRGTRIAKFASATGAVSWERRLVTTAHDFGDGHLQSFHLLQGGDLAVFTHLSVAQPQLYLIDGEDGAIRWHAWHDDMFFRSIAVTAPDRILLAGSTPGAAGDIPLVRSIDVQSGSQLAEFQFPGIGPPGDIRWAWPATGGEMLLAATSESAGTRTIHALATDPASGDVLWRVDIATPGSIENAPQSLVQVADGSLFLGSMTVAAADDQTWTLYKLTGPFADDLFANGYDR
ncbi:MAG: hypothetical protein EOP90_03400 [Lysobacteraceae bacterium]|nr:MAG: hypothetical protein EOP90_03400 [Xanthomonadaceae bacterium]